MNALEVIQQANPRALIHVDEVLDRVTMIEDVGAPNKLYRLEFQASQDGTRAIAFVRYAPDAIPPEMPHLSHDRQLDLSHGWQSLEKSATTIAEAIFKARFWCTAHNHFMTNSHLITLENYHGST